MLLDVTTYVTCLCVVYTHQYIYDSMNNELTRHTCSSCYPSEKEKTSPVIQLIINFSVVYIVEKHAIRLKKIS